MAATAPSRFSRSLPRLVRVQWAWSSSSRTRRTRCVRPRPLPTCRRRRWSSRENAHLTIPTTSARSTWRAPSLRTECAHTRNPPAARGIATRDTAVRLTVRRCSKEGRASLVREGARTFVHAWVRVSVRRWMVGRVRAYECVRGGLRVCEIVHARAHAHVSYT
eukprot:6206735-Pleurochrysis_carterae.AAC.2